MSFFNRKKEEEKPCCCSSGSAGSKYDVVLGEVTSVKVLGAGCKSCHQMYENTKKAVADLGLGIEVEYITNMEKVMQYGAMSMPVLVVNEKVVSAGKVLKPQEAAKNVEIKLRADVFTRVSPFCSEYLFFVLNIL